jgi:hypothetical protein
MATLQMASRHMTVRASLVQYYKNFVRHNRKLPGRLGVDEVSAELTLDKNASKSNRRGSMSFMLPKKQPVKQMEHHGDSKIVEQQIGELKTTVAALLAATQARAQSRDREDSCSPAHGQRCNSAPSLRADSRGTKESPGRSRSTRLNSKSRRTRSRDREHLEA